MCSKSGGSPPVPNATSTAFQSATAPSSFAMPYYQQYLQNASQLAGTPFNPAMLGQVAPLNPNQFEAGADIQNIMQQMGNYVSPVVTAGQNMGTFDPNAVTSIMSPFTQQVTQATQNWFNNQNAIQGNDLLSQGIRSGNAFGGDRAGIAAAQLAGQQQLAQAPVIAGLQQAGYTQALNEYNQLKQMGLAGAQAGLQAGLSQLQPAAAAMGWGNQAQQQQQREFDVAQQNAMMASAYPFQIQNWYGSALGGMGPLLGSFSQGYTTPPPPNATTAITGAITALGGLGTTLFGAGQKRGGPVYKVGGLVRMRNGGLAMTPIAGLRRGPRPHYAGGLVRLRRGGFIPRFQEGGFLGDGTYVSGGGDEGTTQVSVAPQRRRPSFDLAGSGFGRLQLPQYRGGGGPPLADVSGMMNAAMNAARGQTAPNTLADTIKGVAGAAKATLPLFALLERGGEVHHYDDGGNVDADEDEDNTAPVYAAPSGAGATATATPTARARPPAGPVPSADTAALPPMSSPEALAEKPSPLQQRVQQQNPSLEDEQAAAEGAVKPQASEQPRRGYQPIVPGAGGRGVINIGPPAQPRGFFDRLANNPLWNAGIAMLGNRSPYFGIGISAGMQAATDAINRDRQQREGLLDKPGKIVDDGKQLWVQHGNQLRATGLTSPKARGAGRPDAQAESQITQWSRIYNTSLQNDPEWGPQSGKTDLDRADEADRRATERWNQRHPDRQVPIPTAPREQQAEEGTPGRAGPAGAPPPMTLPSTAAATPAPTAARPTFTEPYDYSKPYRPPQEIDSSEDAATLLPPPAPIQTRSGEISPADIRRQAESFLIAGDKGLSPEFRSTRKGNEDNIRAAKVIRNYAYALARAAGIDEKQVAENQANRQYAMRWMLGVDGRTAKSMGVAMRHLDSLEEAHQALQNGQYPLLNKIANYFGIQSGQDPQAAFRALQEIVGAEIVKAVAGAQSGQAERDSTRQALNMNWSPSQFAATKRRVEDALAAQLEGSYGVAQRAGVSDQTYRSIVGTAQFDKLKAVAQQHARPPAPTGGGGGGGGGGGWQRDPQTGNVRGPDGRWYTPDGKPLQ